MPAGGIGGLLGALDRRLFVRLTEETDGGSFDELNSVLCAAYANGMEKFGFRFVKSSDFQDELREVKESGGKTFTVRRAGKPVGTVSCVPTVTEAWYHTGEAMKLCLFGVSPEHQKCGFGAMLMDAVLKEAESRGLPLVLVTPERNLGAVRCYEKYGFCRVTMYMAQDHYTVRMFRGAEQTDPAHVRRVFEGIALSSMLKHRNSCPMPCDEKLVKKWERDFLPYIKDDEAELYDDMRRCFRLYGITPREYTAFNFAKKSPTQRKNYLSARALAEITAAEDKKRFGGRASKLPEPDADKNTQSPVCGDKYNGLLSIVTVRTDSGPELLCAALRLSPKEGKGRVFAAADEQSGEILPPFFVSGDGRCKKSVLVPDTERLPDWESAMTLAKSVAAKTQRTLLSIGLVYTESGWRLAEISAEPRLRQLQQTAKGGLRPRLSELLGRETDVKTVTK